MSHNMCRLCLGIKRLKPLFESLNRHKQYSVNLLLATGLKIEPNDGLPQLICKKCKLLVNSALKLRKQSRSSENKLKNIIFSTNMNIKTEEDTIKEIGKNAIKAEVDGAYSEDGSDIFCETFEGCSDQLEIAKEGVVVVERLTDVKPEVLNNDYESNCFENESKTEEIKPKVKIEKVLSKKEKRKMYLGFVEGIFDPTKPVICKICKKSLKWASFMGHCKLHLGFKIVCEFCGKSFISVTHLNRHCRSLHGMKKEHSCSECDFMAVDNAQLQLHKMRVHTGERPFICNYCGASYFNRRCLIQHIENHSTVKSIKCKDCLRLFKSRRHLARHTYVSHKSKEYTYKCPICHQIYRNLKYIRVHLKKMHGYTTKDVSIIKIKL